MHKKAQHIDDDRTGDGACGLTSDRAHDRRDRSDGIGGTYNIPHFAHIQITVPTIGPATEHDDAGLFGIVDNGCLTTLCRGKKKGERRRIGKVKLLRLS